MASSTMRCSSSHHTVIRCCRSSSMSCTLVWYTRSCITDQMTQSTGYRSGEFGGHMSGAMKSEVLWIVIAQSGTVRWGTVLLEDEHVSWNTSYCRQKLCQQNVPVILSNVHLSLLQDPQISVQCIQVFEIATDTISDWIKVARMCKSRLADTFFFLMAQGT